MTRPPIRPHEDHQLSTSERTRVPSIERAIADFAPSFEFTPPPPLPIEEYEERLRRVRREAVVAGHDVVVIHTGSAGWFHASNCYLRYMIDWMREGVLIVPSDNDKPLTLFSFFTESVILPPGGEPMLVDDIWQVGAIGREYADRPGVSEEKACDAVGAFLLEKFGSRPQIARIGDGRSEMFWTQLSEMMPKAKFVDENGIIDRMQRVRSPREIAMFRAAGQLIDIATQAAYHVTRPGVTDHEIFGAFTFAQMARGGETGDGYQIGINEFGTHCGKPYGRVVRAGDLVNLYVSNVTFQGYTAQSARMIAVGGITAHQEKVIAACVEGVKRAEKLIKPGALFRDVNNAAFEPYVETGLLTSPEARTMPYIWAPMDDGSPRPVKRQYVKDVDWEAKGRKLTHVYPAQYGPHNPNLGHSIGMAGARNNFNVSSHNYDRMEEGMVFVLHTQWIEPLKAGCNVGDLYAVTKDGFENLTRHTPLDLYRV